MNENVKNFANTLAIAGIVVLVAFSAIFLVITYLSKQKAEEINYALYSGILDKKASEIENTFKSASLICKNFNFNINRATKGLFLFLLLWALMCLNQHQVAVMKVVKI